MIGDATGESILVGGIALDPVYAEFRRGNVTDNEKVNPGYGFTVAYHSRMGEATIYVYDMGKLEIPDGPTSPAVMDEFNEATLEVDEFARLTGTKAELSKRYGTGSPERGKEFLCAEFVLSDKSGPQRSFLYVTGAANRFVKIRLTLPDNESNASIARRFVDAVASQLWRKIKADGSTRGNVTMTKAGRFEVLGLVGISVFGSRWWHTEDINKSNAKGAAFRCLDADNQAGAGQSDSG